jgi:hypothetical protein
VLADDDDLEAGWSAVVGYGAPGLTGLDKQYATTAVGTAVRGRGFERGETVWLPDASNPLTGTDPADLHNVSPDSDFYDSHGNFGGLPASHGAGQRSMRDAKNLRNVPGGSQFLPAARLWLPLGPEFARAATEGTTLVNATHPPPPYTQPIVPCVRALTGIRGKRSVALDTVDYDDPALAGSASGLASSAGCMSTSVTSGASPYRFTAAPRGTNPYRLVGSMDVTSARGFSFLPDLRASYVSDTGDGVLPLLSTSRDVAYLPQAPDKYGHSGEAMACAYWLAPIPRRRLPRSCAEVPRALVSGVRIIDYGDGTPQAVFCAMSDAAGADSGGWTLLSSFQQRGGGCLLIQF